MSKNTKAGSLRPVFSMLILFGPALILILISKVGCEHKFKVLDDFGAVPAYTAQSSFGKPLTNKSFDNKVVLYTTIQTSCPDTCATAIWFLDQLIYQRIRTNSKKLGHVRIVSFVTDGEGNPSTDLKLVESVLKRKVEGYDPKLWMLVSGDAEKVYNIKHNGQSLLQKDKKYFAGKAFTELLLLSDKKNHVRMVLSGKSESTIRSMRDHMALLEKEYTMARYKAKKK